MHFLINFYFNKNIFHNILIFIGAILIVQSNTLKAEALLPQCFPSESAWDIIKLSALSPSNENNQKLNITFHKSALTLPRFYGFAYLKNDTVEVPKITNQALLKKHFLHTPLTELNKNEITAEDNNQYFGFDPASKGTWVVYLVASLNQIPFLERKGLRIHPEIERQRGGTVFSGASLNLTEAVDYKACLMTSE